MLNGLLKTTDKVCDRTKGRPKHRETWWWNDKVAKVVEDKRRLFKVWNKSKCEVDKAAYTLAKKVARTEVAKAQEAGRCCSLLTPSYILTFKKSILKYP